ncbi:cytoplasmic polyadenylation element-binding protein 2 isoform X1 [Gallus gallus]|uniref:cytoplasmic polyadenylation element-binding protein 2 isoform X1 n=1 Tax=Gallus gallus TaxID=9031 RepID=UPI001AE56B51|nr:cytoplasmic polyadenylation element-binding protein 2 isoform X1 [Gallus gallus]XP_040525930.1 cytoplasmic polyadenylation element-binding protein 2 isoform X1 [Gallus gallus]XP_046772760.1 cytoplasmic polyadenylation element-binding protein 2 isoform X1 [Gallus gallus]XP_046772761.1 cytoplasmic polyadenylation element-binding protein 2 isoform X1 [Gallus gallus]XP_046772762.1 cytoplasmic polyadenylation element-binding protein 2 isoform X1 [Gallus gallus]XP_046772763.1 cytoplasmic polyaden
MGDPGPPPAPSRSPSPGPPWSFPSPAAASRSSSSSSSCPFSPTAPGSSALFPAHPRGAQEERPPAVTQQQPGGERLGSGPAPGHPPPGHPSSDFKPALGPQQDLNKQQPQQQPPPPPPPSQKRKELKPPPLSPAQLGGSHPPDYHRHPPQQQQQQQFSHPTDKYQQQERRQQQQLQLLGARPPEPPPSLGPLSPAERRAGSERGAPSRAGGPAPADPDVGVAAAASCVNPPPSPPRPRARAEPPPMESPPNSHLLGSPGTLLPGGLGSGFSSLQSPEIPSPHHQSGGGSSSAASPPPPPLPGFGTPWSVQTSSPPPQQTQQPPVSSGGGQISAMPPPSPESETSFYPGIPSSINPAFFQSFSPVSPHNPCAGPFSSPFSAAAPPPPPPPQMNLPQQQQQQQNRRSPVSPQLQHQHQAAAAAAAFLQQRNSYNHHQPLLKQSPWSNQSSGWSTGNISWGGMHGRDHRRTGNMGIPGTMNQISPLKKPFSGNVIAPPKFTRSTPSLTPKSWIEDNVFRTDNNSNTLLPLQDRNRMYDSLNMHSLENSLIDIMRAEHDPLKGRLSYPHPGTDNLLMLNARSYGRRRGRSSLFPIDDGLLDDGHNDQVGVLNSPTCYSGHQNGERIERFSRKVFVGGLPPDIDEDEITASFRRFGPLVVDWPHKAESKSYFPPKGYAFLLFQEESSVQALIDACIEEDGKLYLCVSSPTIKDKPVQIRPWNLSDSDFVMDGSQPLDPRKTIFVGGVPRPLRAVELAMIMDRLYGGVCYAGIDTDPELKYPKGAGRVAFSNQQSYIAAISARFVQLQHGDIDKRVEVKPYVLDDQMCDECQGARCGGKFAPFFCANVTCLQYYCEFCWANIHSRAGREFHKPLVKEGADRPRQIHFRWN